MHRFFARPVCLGLIAFGCGSPGELDRSQFPELEGTGYADRPGVAGAGGAFAGQGGSGFGGSGVGGTGGSAPSPGTGGTPGVGTGGQPGLGGQPSGGTGQGGTGQGGTGQAGTGQGGTGEQPGGCPSDILLLLNRPARMGGCAGDGCHVAGPLGTPPDLTSPGVEARVLNVMSSAACSARPYVGAGESVIAEKISNPDPYCGEPMPFFAEQFLNDADRACILQWVEGLAAGL